MGVKNFRKVFAGGVRNFYFGRGVMLLGGEGNFVGGEGGLLKRLTPFSYLNHSLILSLNESKC